MFINTNDETIVQKLKQHINDEYVMHFTCTECGDEQTTYSDTIDKEFIEEVVEGKEMHIGLYCTNCGTLILTEEIDGIEII